MSDRRPPPPKQNEHVTRLLGEHGPDWTAIHQTMNDRSIQPSAARRKVVPDAHIIKGSFLPEEDEMITRFALQRPERPWREIARVVAHRTAKQCRERWLNHLIPTVNKDPWTEEEDVVIFDLFQQHGKKWAEIARALPGRTDNSIKNRFTSSISNRMKPDETGKLVLMPSTARPYHQKTQKRTPTRAALERQRLALVRPPANDLGNSIRDEDFASGASDNDECHSFEPDDFAFPNQELW
jgi:hypothetical protein